MNIFGNDHDNMAKYQGKTSTDSTATDEEAAYERWADDNNAGHISFNQWKNSPPIEHDYGDDDSDIPF